MSDSALFEVHETLDKLADDILQLLNSLKAFH